MQRIAETVGEFLKGDCGRSRLITGGNIGGHYCISFIGVLTRPLNVALVIEVLEKCK